MKDPRVQGLLLAVIVLLVLNLGTQFRMSSAKEAASTQPRVVGITSVLQGGTIFLFRAFEDGQTETTSTQTDVDMANRGGPLTLQPAVRWSPLKMRDAETRSR